MKRPLLVLAAVIALASSVLVAVALGQAGVPHNPVADFTWSPDQPQPNQVIDFTSTSTDPDGACCASYLWDLDGNGTYGDATAAHTTSSFATEGDHVVGLRVRDVTGRESTITKSVHVAGAALPPPPPNQPPAAKVKVVSPNLWTSSQIEFDASESTDPD